MISVPGSPNGIINKPRTIAAMRSRPAISAKLRDGACDHPSDFCDARAAHVLQRVARGVNPLKRTESATAECQRFPPGIGERDVVCQNSRNEPEHAQID